MQELETLVAEAVKAAGYSWEGQEISNQGRKAATLCVYIDKPGGVTADDCADASRHLKNALKVADLEEQYFLEVSSPGLDRRLFTVEQMQRYLGQEVKVRLYQPVSERRKWVGQLESADESKVVVISEEVGGPVEIPMTSVQWVRLVPQI